MEVDKKVQATNGFGSDAEASVAGSSQARPGLEADLAPTASGIDADVQRNGLFGAAMNGEAQDKTRGPDRDVPVNEQPDPWTKEHLLLLLDQMKALLPENDNFRYNSAEYQMDWEKVKFGDFTSRTCRQCWSQLSTKVRKFRTLSELVFDAEEYVKTLDKGMKIQNQPDFPKKPLTPDLHFCLLKRKDISKLHPQITNPDMNHMLAKTYKDMPERKRMKYLEEYTQEKGSFDEDTNNFWDECPDLVQVTPPKSDLPEKPKIPQQLWFSHEKKVFMKEMMWEERQ